jgi:formate dehydrogenase iron-sulfur subunit
LDIKRLSATTVQPPVARTPVDRHGRQADRRFEVHRLQGLPDGLHGMERSARRRRQNHGVYDNPIDLTPKSWTVMRFSEHENQ